MAIVLTGDHLLPSDKVELSMEGKLGLLTLFEAFHMLALSHPAGEDPSHALDTRLTQLIRLPPIVINSSVEQQL